MSERNLAEKYVSPELKIIDVYAEGVLCSSLGTPGYVPPGGSEDGSWGEDL